MNVKCHEEPFWGCFQPARESCQHRDRPQTWDQQDPVLCRWGHLSIIIDSRLLAHLIFYPPTLSPSVWRWRFFLLSPEEFCYHRTLQIHLHLIPWHGIPNCARQDENSRLWCYNWKKLIRYPKVDRNIYSLVTELCQTKAKESSHINRVPGSIVIRVVIPVIKLKHGNIFMENGK